MNVCNKSYNDLISKHLSQNHKCERHKSTKGNVARHKIHIIGERDFSPFHSNFVHSVCNEPCPAANVAKIYMAKCLDCSSILFV